MPEEQRRAILAAPQFGKVFTDHMVTVRWTGQRGWHDARLEPYAPLPFYPGTSVFHYGQELFEGIKAYRQVNGAITLFRPEVNAARFSQGARRMAMPELPEDVFVQALEMLVAQDRDWVPSGDGYSLYLRPFMIATDHGIGFSSPSDSYLFCVIAAPAAPYFGGEFHPISVWLSQEYTRAAPGGTGAVKTGGNYAAAFAAQRQARENGCDQVAWLDAAEHRWVEELGGMNLFFVYRDGDDARITTPKLTGTLLPGVTRSSLLAVAGALGIKTTEEQISVAQWRERCLAGELTEVFACGTAAVVAPVGTVKGASTEWAIGDGTAWPVTARLREELMGIQYGYRPDSFGWLHKVC
jgi:branched-chain amino acid aminotransferase